MANKPSTCHMTNEKRLIDANDIPWEEHYVPDGDVQWEYKKELCVLKPAIDAMPTVDAVEVVHGEWINWEKADNFIPSPDRHECSVCHDAAQVLVNGFELLSPYCPNCGAKMDGDGNEP